MSIAFYYPGAAVQGSAGASTIITTGTGIYLIGHTGNLQIECWGKGGRGSNGTAINGGGGGGGGGYSKKTLAVVSGDVLNFQINGSGVSTVSSVAFSLSMTANAGNNAVLTVGGSGGTASGGDTNTTGRNGNNAAGTTGGSGGNAMGGGGTGGSGGTSGNNGQVGNAPGGGGGGGGANATGALGGGARIQFTFI